MLNFKSCRKNPEMESVPRNRLLPLPEDAVENIRKIHNLDKPGRLEEAINILEEWIQKQDHIVKKDFSRKYLDTTLISCKGSVEKSKKQINGLCTMKTLMPKFFTMTNAKSELKTFLHIVWLVPLPIVTKDYYRVLLTKINNNNYTAENLMLFYQFNIILSEYIKANDYVNGFFIVYDFSQLNLLDFMTKLNTVELQQFVSILVEGYGARMKGIHILTDSKVVELLIKTYKQFVSEKIGNRMHVHPTLEDLHKAVPKDILPVEYGGKERSIHKLFDDWIEEVSSEKHVEYMKIMNKACTDESQRHAGKFNEEYLGMPGSFRNLSVD